MCMKREGACSFLDIWGFSPECINNTVIQLFVSHTCDMAGEVEKFETEVVPKLRLIVEIDGHHLNVIKFPCDNELQVL